MIKSHNSEVKPQMTGPKPVSPRDIRRRAMQVLYEIDLRGEQDLELIRQGLNNDASTFIQTSWFGETFDSDQVRQMGFELACLAWRQHTAADAAATEVAPDWPTPRQPPIDRAILRLAYYEMANNHVPVKVAINEAIELAKQFCSEHSPPFINGVLDKLARQLKNT